MAAGAVVFDCRPALLPVSVAVSGIDMLSVRSAIPEKSVVVPQNMSSNSEGRICLVILVRSWVLLHY